MSNQTLEQTTRALLNQSDQIPGARSGALRQLARQITDLPEKPNLLFVCTHNSRRSQMAQAWAARANETFQHPVQSVHSAGTEATALHPRAAQALRAHGFDLEQTDNSANPVYSLRLPSITKRISMWSKRFDHETIPEKHLVTVMVCSEAEENCPFIPGAILRFSLPYADPKHADDQPEVDEVYQKCCRQIGRDMLYLFSLINKKN